MIDRIHVLQKLGVILKDNTEVDVAQLSEASVIRGELGLDSVDLVDVVMRIEEAYKIRLSHQDLEKVETIADLVTLITTKASTQNA